MYIKMAWMKHHEFGNSIESQPNRFDVEYYVFGVKMTFLQ